MRAPDIRTVPSADIQIPVEYQGLYDLAYNLWWSWNAPATDLLQRIDPIRWSVYRNPVELLINVESRRWDVLLVDSDFAAAYHAVMDAFREYMDEVEMTWFQKRYPEFEKGPIAYFSSEFGWHESLSIYSGGLGILAGDHCKSASDLGLPFVGIGLMYSRGYFHQTIDADGHQQHHYQVYDFHRCPVLPVSTPSGRPVRVSVQLPGREVWLRLWKAQVGRVPVILLDSDVRENDPADRPITSILYIRGREMRLCQETLLGIGGVKALNAVGIEPSVWHMNEGHSALLAFERIAGLIEKESISFDDALARTSRSTVFTTHTPVPAGNESFSGDLIHGYFSDRFEDWGVDETRFQSLGRADDPAQNSGAGHGHGGVQDTGENGRRGEAGDERSQDETQVRPDFNLTALALRASQFANGVSEMHGVVAREMWKPLEEGSDSVASIGHVTNGVHAPTWIGPEMSRVLQSQLGEHFDQNLDHPAFGDTVSKIASAEIWKAHVAQKRRLVHMTRQAVREQWGRHGRSPEDLRGVESLLDERALTIGFARRFATYKRAALLFRDSNRLQAMLGNSDRPVQLIFAGKAHPADRPGQNLIREIVEMSQDEAFRGHVVFLEDYDIRVAHYLVQGVDLWLNTPRRPQEASGTSGMKAALNGVLNCSILDGWWAEGFDKAHGWAIGEDRDYDNPEQQNQDDAESLYGILESEIVPCYYDLNADSKLPEAWIDRMKLAIGSLAPRFNTARMVREYSEKYYVPASEG